MKKYVIFIVICILVIGGTVHNCKEKKGTENNSSVTTEPIQDQRKQEAESYMIGTWYHVGTYSGKNKDGKLLNMNANTSISVNSDGTMIYHQVKDNTTTFPWSANNDGTINFTNQQTESGGTYSFTIDNNCIVIIYHSDGFGTVSSYYKK